MKIKNEVDRIHVNEKQMEQYKARSQISNQEILIKKINVPNSMAYVEERKKNDDIEHQPNVI